MKACMMDGWMEACMCYILNAIATCISSCPTEWLKTSKEWFLSREGLSELAGCTQSCPGTVPARNGCSCNRTSPRMDWFQLYCAHTSTFTEFSWGFPIEPPMPAGTPGTEFRHGRRWWREIIQFPSGFARCVNLSIIYLSRSIICFLNLCPAVQPELLVAYGHRCELGLTAWWNRLNKTLAGFNCWTSA